MPVRDAAERLAMTTSHSVVLAIDPGSRRSGWSVWCGGKVRAHGTVTELDPEQIDNTWLKAVMIASMLDDAPIVVVIEQPPPATVIYSGRGAAGIASVFAAVGVWKSSAKRWGIPARAIVRVRVSTWRSQALGKGYGGGMARELVHLAEAHVALRECKRAELPSPDTEDAAAAVCIGLWGSHAEAVKTAAEGRRKRASHA